MRDTEKLGEFGGPPMGCESYVGTNMGCSGVFFSLHKNG